MISARQVGSGAAAALREAVAELREAVIRDADPIYNSWHPPIERRSFRIAALNLASYIALRRRDLRALQAALMPLGLSSLGRCESRVMPTLDALLRSLSCIAGESVDGVQEYPRAARFFRGERLLARNTAELFGAPRQQRTTRIMVTLPSEAATDAPFVQKLVEYGMDCARINSAHDGPDTWRAMIANVRAATKATGRRCSVLVDVGGPKMRIEEVEFPGTEERVRPGDTVVLAHGVYGPRVEGAPRAICRLPEIFPQLERGQRVIVDEGRIGARVQRSDKNGAVLLVDQARETGEKLRAQKGLNFPDTQLELSPLTPDDLHVLDAIAEEADLIGYSHVRNPEDISLLQHELRRRRSGALPGIVLKIETAGAIANLPSLIVASARLAPTAVMIARGDLAVERICEAASIPVVWPTQVLDTFTDVAMAERADCVMLNKGPHVLDALEQIASRLRALQTW